MCLDSLALLPSEIVTKESIGTMGVKDKVGDRGTNKLELTNSLSQNSEQWEHRCVYQSTGLDDEL